MKTQNVIVKLKNKETGEKIEVAYVGDAQVTEEMAENYTIESISFSESYDWNAIGAEENSEE